MVQILLAPADAAPEAALSYQEVCPDCVKHDGLCHRHEKAILPQLAQPGWYRLVGNTHYGQEQSEKAHSPQALKIIRRKERRRAKRLRELVELIANPVAA